MILNRLQLSFFLLIFSSLFVFSQTKKTDLNENKTISVSLDSALYIPADFDNTLDYMLQSWIIKQANLPNCLSTKDVASVTDSVYRLRLSKMPCLMEMPYNTTVRSYIDLYTTKKRRQVEYLMGMSNYYFPLFEQELSANNLPLELKYLPIIESALNTSIVSRMGAAGLWQLMIKTGRMYGLEINSLVDERLSPVKATHAAARFLKDLYSIYGDWNLVIASYNCGPGNISKAMRRSGGKHDYWAIYPYLPRETRGYVPVFIAANYSMHYASEHNLCAATVNMPALTDTVMVRRRIHFEQISWVLNLPVEEIRLLNAQYRKDIIPGDIKPYALCLPLDLANLFIQKQDEIAAYRADELINNRRSQIEVQQAAADSGVAGKVIHYKVKSGDTLTSIAARNGVSVKKLKQWNHISGNKVKKGQVLKIVK